MPQGAPDQGSDLSTLYYILFGAESFLLALALTEVIITKGNDHLQRIMVCAVAFSIISSYPKFSDN